MKEGRVGSFRYGMIWVMLWVLVIAFWLLVCAVPPFMRDFWIWVWLNILNTR